MCKTELWRWDFTSCHLKVSELCEKKIGKLALTGQYKQPKFCSCFIQYVKRWPFLLCQRFISPIFVDLPFEIKKNC